MTYLIEVENIQTAKFYPKHLSRKYKVCPSACTSGNSCPLLICFIESQNLSTTFGKQLSCEYSKIRMSS